MPGGDLKAYTAVEECSGDNAGTVVFAKSNVHARRHAANELNDGEFSGLTVRREPCLDQYTSKYEIPTQVMIDLMWWTTCTNCGRELREELYYDNGYDYDDEDEGARSLYKKTPAGTFFDNPFCDDVCEHEHAKFCELKLEITHRETARLQGIVETYFKDVTFFDNSAEYFKRPYVWLRRYTDPPTVKESKITFQVAGAKYPSSLGFREEDLSGDEQTAREHKGHRFYLNLNDREALYANMKKHLDLGPAPE